MQASLFTVDQKIGDIERELRAEGVRYVVGLDEAGRGPLAGPVYAGAVVVDLEKLDESWLSRLDDSKKLKESARDAAKIEIVENAVAFSVAFKTAQDIDEINILQASLRAMEAALAGILVDLEDVVILVDGKQKITSILTQYALIKGDSRSYAIAAASILAKVARDLEMVDHHATWPEYGFDSHKGYPSKRHRVAISEHGPCAIHRLTFSGAKEHAHRLRP
jgi:ribonuclease HII